MMENTSRDDYWNNMYYPYYPDESDFPEYQATAMIWNMFPPCILLLGGFGNIATIFVMQRIKDHHSSQHVFLMALAVSDLVFLYTSGLDLWLFYVFGVKLGDYVEVGCKLLFWMKYVSCTTSAWLVTSVTMQRTVAVLWPHKIRVVCTVRRMWFVTWAIFLVVCALHSHMLQGYGYRHSNACIPKTQQYATFFYKVYSWVDMCLASAIPSVCMIVCDIILSVTLFKAASFSAPASGVTSNASTAQSTDSRRKVSYRTTITVLVISCAFVVLTMPLCIHIIWQNFVYMHLRYDPQRAALKELISAISYQLLHTNSAINFFLYCLTGKKFRREFKNWIRCFASGVPAPEDPEIEEEGSGRQRKDYHGKRLQSQ